MIETIFSALKNYNPASHKPSSRNCHYFTAGYHPRHKVSLYFGQYQIIQV